MKRRLVRQELGEFMEKYDLDGVDYNWEYPGYRFGQGYLAESEVKADYEGLSKLVFETRQMYVDKAMTKVERITVPWSMGGKAPTRGKESFQRSSSRWACPFTAVIAAVESGPHMKTWSRSIGP
eukprot:g33212.t1